MFGLLPRPLILPNFGKIDPERSSVSGYRYPRAYFRFGGVASNPNSIPLNPPSKGGLPIRFPLFQGGLGGIIILPPQT